MGGTFLRRAGGEGPIRSKLDRQTTSSSGPTSAGGAPRSLIGHPLSTPHRLVVAELPRVSMIHVVTRIGGVRRLDSLGVQKAIFVGVYPGGAHGDRPLQEPQGVRSDQTGSSRRAPAPSRAGSHPALKLSDHRAPSASFPERGQHLRLDEARRLLDLRG